MNKDRKIAPMKTKFIHSVILMLLLALTAHEAHAAVSHDVEACEVCIHVQTNDDMDVDSAQTYIELETALHIKCSGNINEVSQNTIQSADLIRGPPKFS